MFFTILALLLMVYGALLFVGGYETENGLTMNSTLAANYNSIGGIGGATATPGGLVANYSQLGVAQNITASKVNQTGSGSSAVVNSVSLVYNFMTSIPGIIGSIIYFVAIPLTVVGIKIGFAEIIVSVMFTGIIALGIVSAIFLFPIILLPPVQKSKKRNRPC